jgi:hypothetical protein
VATLTPAGVVMLAEYTNKKLADTNVDLTDRIIRLTLELSKCVRQLERAGVYAHDTKHVIERDGIT